MNDLLPVEKVADVWLESELNTPFGVMKQRGTFEPFAYQGTRTRLIELLRRARADGQAAATSGFHMAGDQPGKMLFQGRDVETMDRAELQAAVRFLLATCDRKGMVP